MTDDRMRQKETLSPKQEQAMELLVAGKTVSQAAEVAGVARQTVHRWLRDDNLFIAELNSLRHEMIEAGRTRLAALAERAIDTVEAAIQASDARVAIAVLTKLEILSEFKAGPRTVEDAEAKRLHDEMFRTIGGF